MCVYICTPRNIYIRNSYNPSIIADKFLVIFLSVISNLIDDYISKVILIKLNITFLHTVKCCIS